VIARLRLPRPRSRPRPRDRFHCEADDWTFDARYTQGRCPICGWTPEGAPTMPRWMSLARRADWEMVGLLVLLDVLVLLGLVVARAAGLIG